MALASAYEPREDVDHARAVDPGRCGAAQASPNSAATAPSATTAAAAAAEAVVSTAESYKVRPIVGPPSTIVGSASVFGTSLAKLR